MATQRTKAFLQALASIGQTEWQDLVESVYPGTDVTTEVGVLFINAGTNGIKKWNLASANAPTSGSFVQTGYTTGSIVYHTGNDFWICTSDTPSTSTWKNLTALNSISDTDVDNITATLSVITGADLKLVLESIDSAIAARPTSVPTSTDWIDDTGTTDTDKSWSNSKLYSDEIGDRNWGTQTLDIGVITDSNLTEAINLMAVTVSRNDSAVKDGTVGISRTVVATNYDEVQSVDAVDTSILIACANFSNFAQLIVDFQGKYTGPSTGQIKLFIDDALFGTIPITQASYTDSNGVFNIGAETGNHKIELKIRDNAPSLATDAYAKLTSVVLKEG